MPVIPMCKAVCGYCARESPYPELGDFAYGQFILHRDDGQDFRYLQGLGNDVWDCAAAHVSAGLLQEVVARLADAPAGRYFTIAMVCPYCGSRRFRDWGGEQLSSRDIPSATFRAFAALGPAEKKGLLERLAHDLNAEPAASPNGGPAKWFGNSGVGGGPPSVS